MHLIARVCAAALPLLVAIPANAQTAVETVAFLTLGIEASQAGTSDYGRREFNLIDDEVVEFRSYFPGGRKIQDMRISQTGDCAFTITGTDFNSDFTANRDVTLDFSAISPTETFQQYNRYGDAKAFEEIKSYYYTVQGIKICSNGESFNAHFERFPPAGTCRNELQTSSFDSRDEQNRMLGALAYLRSNFCKPRAF